jgi:hypothetical protein
VATRKTFTFDDFRGGYVASTMGARLRSTNQWTGVNMVPCRDGSLCVRKGVRRLNYTGMPTTGNLLALGTVPSLTPLWFVNGNTVYRQNGATSVASMGTLGATPSTAVPWTRHGFVILITVDGDKCYRIDPINNSFTAWVGTPGGQDLFLKSDRLHVLDGHRVKWSRYNVYNDFVNDGTDAGGGEREFGAAVLDAVGAVRIRDSVLIAKQVEGVYVLTGDVPTNYNIRLITTADTAQHWSHMAEWQGALLTHRSNAAGQAPVRVGGGAAQPLWDLAGAVQTSNLLSSQDDMGVAGDPLNGSAVIMDGADRKALLFSAPGVWSYHSFDLPTLRGGLTFTDGLSGTYFLGGTTGANIYKWQADMGGADVAERPGNEADADARAGDDSASPVVGEFTVPEIEHPDGGMMRPIEVVVDFRSYPTGGSQANSLSCDVVCVERPDQSSNTLSSAATQSWTETVTPITLSGHRRQVRFGMGEQAEGSSWRVRLHGIRGLRITRVRVVCDLSRPQNR